MTYKLKEFNSTQQRVCDSFKIRNECLLNKELELHVFVISGHHISNEVPEKKIWDSHFTSKKSSLPATTFIGMRRGRENLNDNPKEHDALI